MYNLDGLFILISTLQYDCSIIVLSNNNRIILIITIRHVHSSHSLFLKRTYFLGKLDGSSVIDSRYKTLGAIQMVHRHYNNFSVLYL